jgi:FkbM family methyltransferase
VAAKLHLETTTATCVFLGRPVIISGDSELPSSVMENFFENLRRICLLVSKKYPDSPMIDIGANIGDTAIIMRSAAPNARILCIEGSPYFHEMCKQNVPENCIVLNAFIDQLNGKLNVSLSESEGTARANASSGSVNTLTLREAAKEGFLAAKLVKIDTDGFDGRIIVGAAEWIGEAKPVLLWEFELTGDEQVGGPGMKVFDILAGLGYRRFVFYSNTGDYIASVNYADKDVLDDLTIYLGLRKNRPNVAPNYADVCAIHESDLDIFEQLRLEGRRAAVS